MPDDAELLRRYADGSESAFTELVQRRMSLVYGAALRRVGNDPQLAEEVAQIVFTQCALKARALHSHPSLSGWLHRATRFAAIDALRMRRRRVVTGEIETMNLKHEVASGRDLAWAEVRPVIDALLDRLGDRDRDAVALRFFEGCTFAQIGAKLRVSEDAARMRVDRALDKLRDALRRRGLNSTAAALGLALAQSVAQAAPAGLATTVSAGALAAATAGGTGALAGGAFFLMNKISVGVVGAMVVAGLSFVVVESRASRDLRRDAAELRLEIDRLARPEMRTSRLEQNVVPAMTNSAAAELARLRARIDELKARPDGVVDSEIKPRSAWKNSGHATPEAAIETFIWAATRGDIDALSQSFSFGDRTKAEADAFFATLSPELQAKYGSPERLFAPYIIDAPKEFRVDAMQVIGVEEGDRPDEAIVRYWVRSADGKGHEDTLPFRQFTEGWRMGSRAMGTSIPAAVEFIRTHVDPAIGARASDGK